jgi:DNA-directed RNA polymerase subunit RPC12/RpoP
VASCEIKPFCVRCGTNVNEGRMLLGYNTCLPCGDKEARKVRHTIVPMNKSNYIVVTDVTILRQLNPKRTV